MTKSKWKCIPLLLILWSCLIECQDFTSSDSCSLDEPYSVQIEPDADVMIGALLDLHRPGQGVFGCGRPSTEGVQYYEALRWSVNVLNQNTGEINGQEVNDSFIPGIKFGLQVYDSCGHRDLAMRHMTELFPIMKSGSASCDGLQENSSSIIGMVDTSRILTDPRVAETAGRYIIPVVPLHQETAVPPEQMAKVLAEVVHDMDWERVAVLHEDDEYSIFVAKVFSQIAKAGYPCITSIKSLPSPDEKEGGQFKTYHKILTSFASKLTDKTGVIVIAQGKVLEMILRAFGESQNSFSRLQWLFSWMPPFSKLQTLGNWINKSQMYSLSPYPSAVSSFEDYFKRLGDISSLHNSSDRFFMEFAMSRKNCKIRGYRGAAYDNLVMCDNLILKEDPTDGLMRTARFLPTLHALFTFAHAYKKAWVEKCLSVPGVCNELRYMTRREFVEQYLEPLEFEHHAEYRSPPEVQGQKTNQGVSGEMEGMQVALSVYTFSQSVGVQFKQVLAYDAQEAKVIDATFRYTPSVCPKGGCKDCISVRQSRLEDPYVGMASTEDIVIASQSDDISIPILLPIHKAGRNPLECSEKIDEQAIQDLEAALWTVDQINRDTEFLPDIRLRVVAIDTCSSPVQITQKLSNYLLDNKKKDLDDITSDLAFITIGNPDEVRAASAIISPLNITTISVKDSIRPKDMDSLHLQVALPLEKKTKATVDTLVYLGWNYVTVIHDGDSRSELMLESFKSFAKEHDICVSVDLSPSTTTDAEMDRILMHVVEAKTKGARAVVMYTNEKTTEAFLKAVHKAVLAGLISRGDLVIISSGDWIVNLQSFKEFENEVTGVIVLKTQQGEVEDFNTYFQRLDPNENRRNPWFRQLWEQKQECKEQKCATEQPITYSPSSSTVNIIQGLLAISAGLARLRNEHCHPQPGLCPKMLQSHELRKHLFSYIRETASSRLDARGEMFAFTKQGYGNLPIEIFNFRRAAGKNFVYEKVGTYQSHLNNLAEIVMYNSDGQEISVDKLSSECLRDCEVCGRRPTDFVILDSKDHLYLATSVDIHQSTANPLICNSDVEPSGMQTLEAFLWALDQINSSPQLLPGVNLGAIVFDTCSSKEKAARDVANFFSSSISATTAHKLPSVNQILGLVATQNDDVIQPIIDVSMPFQMMTVAPRVTSTPFNDKGKYPTLLRLSLPNDVRAGALVDLLKHFKWNYVSALYSEEAGMQLNLFQAFKEKAEAREIELALAEKIPSSFSNAAMSVLFNKLQFKRNEGARVVVLFLDASDSMKLFSIVKTELDGGRMDIGDFVWLTFETLVDSFHSYPLVSLGALMVQPSYASVFPFKHYFSSLSPRNNSRNPWFRDYWEQVYKCKGGNCEGNRHSLSEITLMQDSSVAKVINSVLSVGVGLEALRQHMCPGLDHGLCPALREESRVRELLYNLTMESTFTGADGKMFKFTQNGYSANVLDVLNFRQVGNNAHAFVNVGQYSPDEGLSLNFSKVKAYNEFGKEISLYDIQSACNGCKKDAPSIFSSTMQMVPRHDFAITILMPVHKKSKNFFSCGDLKDESIFHHLTSIAYAVDRINKNSTLMPGIEMGAIVFDYCERPQKGEELLYSFFSKEIEDSAKMRIKPKAIVAALTYGKDMSKEASPIFDSLDITHIATPIDRLEPDVYSDVLYTAPSMLAQIQALIGILNNFKWQYVNIVYSNTDFGRAGYYSFSKAAKEMGVCLANVVLVEPDSTRESLIMNLQNGLSRDATVVVSLVDDDRVIESMVEAIKNSYILSRYVWVGTETWGDNALVVKSLEDAAFDAITLKMENNEMPEFGKFYEKLTLRNHYPIPDLWFEEFWQHRFQCQLSKSLAQKREYALECTGKEELSSDELSPSEHVYQTVRTVEAIAEGLHNYLKLKCPYGMAATSIDDCGNQSRKDLYKEIQSALHGAYEECEECGRPSTVFGYDILQHSRSTNGTNLHTQIGSWKDNMIYINDSLVRFSNDNPVPKSLCKEECGECASPHQGAFVVTPGQPIYANFETVWGIIVTALSVLGLVLVIICALYFLMSFPITVGTTTVWGIIVTALSVLGLVLVIICALYFLMSFPITVGTTTVWGIIVTALSVLGLVLVIICALYFLMSFPITVGTTTVWGIIVTALSVLGLVLVIICALYFLMSFPITVGKTTVWGIIVTALSVLGLVLVIICALYFLMSFPITVGTTTVWGIIVTALSVLGLVLVIICALYFLMSFPIKVGTTTVWGIIVTALSVLGLVLVIICALYFLMSFPITVGTTTVWGIIVTALSVLGLVLVIICALYFLMSFPITVGTTTVWGIIVTALSVLGLVLVIICALYFLMSFPITVGTTTVWGIIVTALSVLGLVLVIICALYFLMSFPITVGTTTVWGIIVTALSVLGLVLVIICALYFLMSFPITVGTTVLGYMILFGLLLLYSVNFAFILSPTEGTCGIRRFGLGLAYAVIFSGMLVKVMNTWRLMGYNGSRILSDGTRLSSPAGLLVIAVGLVIIQIVLSAAWLILMPPETGAYEQVWRCAPPTTFEEGLVVSLIYVMLLLAITTLFALLTWQCQDNNRESRWICACAILVAVVWLAWTILSTQLSPHYRDTTIAAANLVNATIIMIFLYLRKVYLYSKLTRQARDQDMKAHLQPTTYSHSIYGSSQKTFSTLAPVLYGSQASLTTKKLYNGPSSRVELINCPEVDNKSDSSGSVQVQATDLYPLDMYDGGSQFQPVTSLYGSNHTLVLDDTLTFGR